MERPDHADGDSEKTFAGWRPTLANSWPCLVLFFIPLILFWKTTGYDFISTWDDGRLILQNSVIQTFNFENIQHIFTTVHKGFYQPIFFLSLAVDHTMWGLNPAGFHLSNVLLHAINSCLAYFVITMLTKQKWVAFFAALLFAVHPVNVENIAWVAEKKTMLATLFFFLALIAYIRSYAKSGPLLYFLSIIFFTLGLLSKVTIITLPLILLCYEVLLCKNRKGWVWTIPFFAISAVMTYVTLWAQKKDAILEAGTLSLSALFGNVYPTMTPVMWKYIGMLVWPFNLSGFYDTPPYNSFLTGEVFVSLVAWIAVFIAVLWRGNSQARFWFLWYWICLLPVANIIPNIVFYADRFLYTPAIGLFVLLSMAGLKMHTAITILKQTKRKSKKTEMQQSPMKKWAVPAVGVLLIFVFSLVAFNRADVWRSEITFWEDTAVKSPNMFKARANLGVAYDKAGRFLEAEREYLAALRIYSGREARMIKSNLLMLRSRGKQGR